MSWDAVPDYPDYNATMIMSVSAIVGKCDICGKDAYTLCYSNNKIVATRCQEHPYDFFNTTISLSSNYNYKCPDCHGEFNSPALATDTGTYFPKKCPFCGRVMEGL
jgi:hypothetical protein